MHHIRTSLPEIKSKIQAALLKYQQELLQLGDPLVDGKGGQASMVLNIITEFCTEFRTIIDGNSNDLSSFELSGGARISFVFHELYSNGVKSIDPLEQTKDSDIRTLLYNSSVRKKKTKQNIILRISYLLCICRGRRQLCLLLLPLLK